jgi:hypothetical protein
LIEGEMMVRLGLYICIGMGERHNKQENEGRKEGRKEE